ncbi:hypothetical protein SO802_015740 [Lithocarpus litseifolius]|uniref:Uncharacterized protein n=1 Tax=Lithocarpus litseifolius TaxID=425828 RepID=A0AAW2CWX2_9ROSI
MVFASSSWFSGAIVWASGGSWCGSVSEGLGFLYYCVYGGVVSISPDPLQSQEFALAEGEVDVLLLGASCGVPLRNVVDGVAELDHSSVKARKRARPEVE